MKKLILLVTLLLGLCFLSIQCRNNDYTDEYDSGGRVTREYTIDSFSIGLISENEQEIVFDSTLLFPDRKLEEVIFEVIIEEYQRIVQQPKYIKTGFEAVASPSPLYDLLMDSLQITSGKDIEAVDSVYRAGTDLSPLFIYALSLNTSSNWEVDTSFLKEIRSDRWDFLRHFYVKLPLELSVPIDQTFTVTITGPNGEKTSAVSPRVLAK